jgi:hypothetical protein
MYTRSLGREDDVPLLPVCSLGPACASGKERKKGRLTLKGIDDPGEASGAAG